MERNRAIDIAKGIGIFLVIIAHNEDIGFVRGFIYTFHMPLFFILAGYFFKEKSNGTTLKSSYQRLIKPYIFSCVLYLLWYIAFGLKYHSMDMIIRALESAAFGSGAYHGDVIWGQEPTIGMIWFLLALFWCRFVYNFISQISGKYKYIIGGLVAIVATLIDDYIINLPFAILPGLSAIMFYMLGNLFREHKMEIACRKNILIPLGLICWFIAILYFGTSMVNCSYGCYPIDIIGACFATYVIYKLSEFISCKGGKIAIFFTWVGVNSMTILCAHFLEQSTFIWQHIHIPENWYVILPIKFIYVICFTLIAYRIPYTRNLLGIHKYGE